MYVEPGKPSRTPESVTRTGVGGAGGGEWGRVRPLAPAQPLHRGARGPREVHAGRPVPRDHRGRAGPGHAGPVPGLDGHRARARDHDQGPERADRLAGPHRQPDRHPGPRRLRLRGVAEPRRLRGRRPGGRREPGDRGPDARQLLPRARARPRDRGRGEQDRPARRRPRPRVRGDRARARRAGRGDPADLGQDRRGRDGAARRDRREHPAAGGRGRRAAPGAHLRLVLRPVPRRHQLGARVQRHADHRHQVALPPGERDARRRGDRHPPARAHPGAGARSGRGRVPHRRDQGRRRGARRRDRDHRATTVRGPRGLPRPEADGVLRAVPGGG